MLFNSRNHARIVLLLIFFIQDLSKNTRKRYKSTSRISRKKYILTGKTKMPVRKTGRRAFRRMINVSLEFGRVKKPRTIPLYGQDNILFTESITALNGHVVRQFGDRR